ncbi:thioesterase family protein [Cytobacillus sp. IB215665]|uniref:acyl-CoA thioesterase n=1 Tax=Cytobacillus sp. IB215665 TaxID=3097357 RepID=UPI002A0B8065|nr:thioesterase family protein [Cytobacillus sp. IB215665]MDX8366953.1 thioesterase family protein [Cytobacillus sp. IB215665]
MLKSKKKIEVRYAETDQMGVVNHANYLTWMEVGRTKYIQDLGFSYAAMEDDGILCPVLEAHVSYKKPIRYGEIAEITTWVEEYDGLRVVYGYEIANSENELAVCGTTKHVCVKKDSFRPISIAKYFPEWHEAYEKVKKQR